ncbi:alpha/beta-hydrolase [Wolfiporia cocos MD-104 SS10]|uniref:Alpha/beta-hydrolase n=1 Tax=Wolfiporia cocos (strain MD-104) TaxID=742152 RepID=A0A2H3IUG1_WOLCO|nr:alpha/beta-hydrolase [Wolfiporia cocos MD-104 SS10]
MSTFRSLISRNSDDELTPQQTHMYASETLVNFRTIARLCATRSSYTLGVRDLAAEDLLSELADLGEFAQIAYGTPEPGYLFSHLDMLMQPDFPFEGFNALRDAELVGNFCGEVARVPVVVVYRKSLKQLVVGFSGTANIKQTLYDLYPIKQTHPTEQGCAVHSGFWTMYEGLQRGTFEHVERGLRKHDVQELASVGHSMGGALAYYFALDFLSGTFPLPSGLRVKVATFGSPRTGDAALSERWQERVSSYQTANGEGSVREYRVNALNDGVPSLPPVSWGYRHLTRTPLYFYHGRLFQVPAVEGEHGVFAVALDALDKTRIPDHPKGGHNYYNGRDAEKIIRRIYWMNRLSKQSTNWEKDYLTKIAELERAWQVGHRADTSSGTSVVG